MSQPKGHDLYHRMLEEIENNAKTFMSLQFEHNSFFRNELKEQKTMMEYINKELDDMSKEFMSLRKNLNALIEEKFLKIDDLARNVDRISLDVDSLKLRSIPPKYDINESLKAMRISIDECKERTTKMHAKKDWFVKMCSSSFRENNDENIKVIDVTPIESLFSNINLDKDGTGDESTLVKMRPNDSEFLDLDAKIDKCVSVGNNTYGITRIPTMVAGHRVVRRAGLVVDTGIVYPGSGREDA